VVGNINKIQFTCCRKYASCYFFQKKGFNFVLDSKRPFFIATSKYGFKVLKKINFSIQSSDSENAFTTVIFDLHFTFKSENLFFYLFLSYPSTFYHFCSCLSSVGSIRAFSSFYASNSVAAERRREKTTHTLSLSLSHTHSHAHTHSHSLSLSHTHAHTYNHTLSLSFSRFLSLHCPSR
jgi:hypothetical protein